MYTLYPGPSVSPTSVILTSVTSTTVTMSWEPPPPDLQNGIIRKYTVKVANNLTGNLFLLNTTKTEILVGMLHPYYFYGFAVTAVTVEPGPFSGDVTVSTLEDGEFSNNIIATAKTANNSTLKSACVSNCIILNSEGERFSGSMRLP